MYFNEIVPFNYSRKIFRMIRNSQSFNENQNKINFYFIRKIIYLRLFLREIN